MTHSPDTPDTPDVVADQAAVTDRMSARRYGVTPASPEGDAISGALPNAYYECAGCTQQGSEGNCRPAEEIRLAPDETWLCEHCYDDAAYECGEDANWPVWADLPKLSAALTAQPVAQDEDSPARIWLEPICAYDALGGRTWSDTRQERCDDCNLDPVEYIRADLAPVAIALGVSVQSVGPLSVNIFGARQAKCATEGCTERAIDHIVAGDVGSDFCVTCSDKIQASSAAPVGGEVKG